MSRKLTWGGVPNKLERVTAVGAFKVLSEGVGAMGSEEEYAINKTQPKARLIKCRTKDILFKEAHEWISIGQDHLGAHGS